MSESSAPSAAATLYTLLLDHPLDQQGHCRSCRRSGAMIGLRCQPCRIHLRARYWLLRHPDEAVAPRYLTSEFGPGATSAGALPRCAMVQVRPEGKPATVSEPEFLPETPAGRRSSTPESPAPGGQTDPTPVLLSPAAAARELCARFLANADRGNHAANDELVVELVRRIRTRQTAALEASEQGPPFGLD